MKTVTSRIPEEDDRFLTELEKDQQTTRAEVLRRLLSEAIAQKRKEKALRLLSEGKISIRKAGQIAQLTYPQALMLATEIESGYDTKELQKDIDETW